MKLKLKLGSFVKKRPAACLDADYLAKGNAARDMHDWMTAVANYERHLQSNLKDSGIWVQMGNCAKEAGDYKASLSAYRRALVLRPDCADTYLQIGHLYKRMGRVREAKEHYRLAQENDPNIADAQQELANLQSVRLDLPFSLPMTYLDFLTAETPDELIKKVALGNVLDDPFRIYENLLN